MSKKLKFNLNKLTKETFSGTQVGVLLEDIDEKLTLISEGYLSVNKRLDILENGQEFLKNGQEFLKNGHEFLKNGQESILSRLDRMETKLDATFEITGEMKVDITQIKDDVEIIKDDLNKKADKDELRELDGRVLVLENKINI